VELDQQRRGEVQVDARFRPLGCDQRGGVAESDDVVQLAWPTSVDDQQRTRRKRRSLGAVDKTRARYLE
jgi:hypothetical protein